MQPEEYQVPFGKFKGQKLADIDTGYIRWLAENAQKVDLKSAALAVLQKRGPAEELPKGEPKPRHQAKPPAAPGIDTVEAVLFVIKNEYALSGYADTAVRACRRFIELMEIYQGGGIPSQAMPDRTDGEETESVTTPDESEIPW